MTANLLHAMPLFVAYIGLPLAAVLLLNWHRGVVAKRRADRLARERAAAPIINPSIKSLHILRQWGYVFEIDADRNRLIGRAPAGSLHRNRIWRLDVIPIQTLAGL